MIRHFIYLAAIVLLVGWSTDSASAQVNHNHAQCGVGYDDGLAIKNRMLNNRRNLPELLQQFERGRSNDSTVWVPVQFHIVNQTDGTGGESISDVLANLCKLNEDYKHLNVEFYLAGPINFINQDLLYTNDFGATASYFMGMYKVFGVANVFIGNQIQNGQSGGTTLGYYTSGLDVIYCIQGAINGGSSTLTHEFGHFFSLPHTFFGWEGQDYQTVMGNTQGRTPSFLPSGAPVENIVRSGGMENCQIAADGFCDTDANYLFGFFGGKYNNGCEYAGAAHDPLGVLFRPDIISPSPFQFNFKEGEKAVQNLFLWNRCTKEKMYLKTKVIIEPKFTPNGGGPTVSMWADTIGDTDTTDFLVNKNGYNDIININSSGSNDVHPGFINLGDYTLDVNITSANNNLSFIAAPAMFKVDQSGGHETFFDSIRVTNTSATDTVFDGTTIDIEEMLVHDMNGVEHSETWSLTLDTLLPNSSRTLTGPDAKSTGATSIAGVVFDISTYSVSPDTSGTTSENIMSYYNDACVSEFSAEQGEAMKADIASRGFATLYSAPTDPDSLAQATVTNPTDGAEAPNPLIHFTWNAVNGATMYHVHIYESNIFGQPLTGGEEYDFMTADTDSWIQLDTNNVGVNYGWTVTPLNAVAFCDPIGSKSSIAQFKFNDWTVDVNKVQNTIASSALYPNPAGVGNEVILEIKSNKADEARISIYNGLGQRMIDAQLMTLTPGSNVQRINTAALPAGLYLVTIKTVDGLKTHKLQIKK